MDDTHDAFSTTSEELSPNDLTDLCDLFLLLDRWDREQKNQSITSDARRSTSKVRE